MIIYESLLPINVIESECDIKTIYLHMTSKGLSLVVLENKAFYHYA